MKTPTFRKWLSDQRKRQDPVGDLARDVAADAEFPGSRATYDLIRAHLEDVGASPNALAALDRAIAEYQASTGVQGISTPEQRLMLAVSYRMQEIRGKYPTARDARGRELFRIATEWFESGEERWPLSRRYIAAHVGEANFDDPDGLFETALTMLSSKEEEAIRMRFAFPHGLGDMEVFTFREIGTRLGVGAQRASNLVARGLLRLRRRPRPGDGRAIS